MEKVDESTKNHFNIIIDNYEKKLQRNEQNFKLSDFERLLIEEAMIYGYEYAKNERMI